MTKLVGLLLLSAVLRFWNFFWMKLKFLFLILSLESPFLSLFFVLTISKCAFCSNSISYSIFILISILSPESVFCFLFFFSRFSSPGFFAMFFLHVIISFSSLSICCFLSSRIEFNDFFLIWICCCSSTFRLSVFATHCFERLFFFSVYLFHYLLFPKYL